MIGSAIGKRPTKRWVVRLILYGVWGPQRYQDKQHLRQRRMIRVLPRAYIFRRTTYRDLFPGW